MTGREIALDTSVAVEVLNRGSKAGDWATVYEVHCLSVTVVGELLFGALNSSRSRDNLAKVDALLRSCRVLDVDQRASRTYAEIRVRLKKSGRPIPENDLWIAAVSLRHGVPLLTHDAHFSQVEGLTVVRP